MKTPQGVHGRVAEPAELEDLDAGLCVKVCQQPRLRLGRRTACGDDEGDGHAVESPCEVVEPPQRGRVAPVRVVNGEGETEMVISVRRKFQRTMREDLVSGIELLTERTVLSFMSDHDADHDYAAEVFVLDAAPAERAGSAEPDTRPES